MSHLADLIVVVHLAYVLFVVGGMALILIGIVLRWSWIRNFWFRAAHLAAIGLVVLESLFGVMCPLTRWENQLRGEEGSATSFIGRLVHAIMFFNLPEWFFTVTYCLFGAAVVLAFIIAPPRGFGRKS